MQGDSSVSIIAKLHELGRLRAAADSVRTDYETKRAQIQTRIQGQLDALDEAYAPLLGASTERIASLETEVKSLVLDYGASVKGDSVRAVYVRGRVTWDTKSLNSYSDAHPEILEFRNVSAPSVRLCRIKAPGEPVRCGEDETSDPSAQITTAPGTEPIPLPLWTHFYHITHHRNLAGILQHGILSWTESHSRGLTAVDISDPEVQAHRDGCETVYGRKIHDYASLYLTFRMRHRAYPRVISARA